MGNKWNESLDKRRFDDNEGCKFITPDISTGEPTYAASLNPVAHVALAEVPATAEHLRFCANVRERIKVNLLPPIEEFQFPLDLDDATEQGVATVLPTLHQKLEEYPNVQLLKIEIARYWDKFFAELIAQDLETRMYEVGGLGDYGRNRYRVYTIPFRRKENDEMPTDIIARNTEHIISKCKRKFNGWWDQWITQSN